MADAPDMTEGEDDADDDDGWTSVRGKSASRRNKPRPTAPTSAMSPSRPSPNRPGNHGIRKSTRATPSSVRVQSTVVVAPPADMDSSEILAERPFAEPNKSPPPFRLVGLPLRRSKSAMETVLREVLAVQAVPLTRSAASELAITLGNDMNLEE